MSRDGSFEASITDAGDVYGDSAGEDHCGYPDGGTPEDAGAPYDAGASVDAGTPDDAGEADDAGD